MFRHQYVAPKEEAYALDAKIKETNTTVPYIAPRDQCRRHSENITTHFFGTSWEATQPECLGQERFFSVERTDKVRKQREDLIDTLSHEMRNPLQGIISSIEVQRENIAEMEKILREGKISENVATKLIEHIAHLKQTVSSLEECSQHQRNIIEDVLDISKLESGKTLVYIKPFSLKETLRSAVERFTSDIAAKRQQLDFCLPQEEYIVASDGSRFKQIVFNLLSNAIKHTPEGGHIRLQVSVKVQEEKAEIFMKVQDSSAGFSEIEKQQLFDRFSKISRSKHPKYSSSGLSLVRCKEICNLLGGEISVESQKWQGACFNVKFNWPLIMEPELKYLVPESPTLDEAAFTGKNNQHIKILIVEDNAINQKLLKRLIEKAGYQSVTANNGIEAIKHYQAFKPHFIFMDIEMPELDGFEATQAIRNIEKQFGLTPVPIYAWTAYVREEYQAKATEVGLDGFITKPVKKEKIYAAIEHELKSKPIKPSSEKESIYNSVLLTGVGNKNSFS